MLALVPLVSGLVSVALAEPPEMVALQVVLLEKGPGWSPDATPELEALQAAHLAHLGAAWEAGAAELCGPTADPSGTLRGVCLYDTPSAEEARAWAERDPMVAAGRLTVRVVPWWTGAGFVAFPHSHDPGAADPRGPVREGHGGEAHGGSGSGTGDHATVTHRFDDVERWSQVFDDPDRAAWQRPQELVAALGIERRMVVADIGAGTGYFNGPLAEVVGRRGRVVAVEVERSLVDHMVARAEADGTPQVVPRLGRLDDPGLLPGEVDRILMVDTYHHIDDRRDYFARLRPALRSGGQLVVVDFKPGELPVGPPSGHKLAPDTVVDELTAAGWRAVDQLELLPHQYVLVFEPGGPDGR